MERREIDEVQVEAWGGTATKSSWLERTLWFAAGGNPALLERCPYADRVKYQSLGGMMWAVSALALCASSYALYVVFAPKLDSVLEPSIDAWTLLGASGGGLLFALAVLNLNRFIICSTGRAEPSDRFAAQALFSATPRLAMAVVIGLCIAAPLGARVLKSEVDQELATEQQNHQSRLRRDKQKAHDTKSAAVSARARQLETELGRDRLVRDKLKLEVDAARTRLEDEQAAPRNPLRPMDAALKETLRTKQTELAIQEVQLSASERIADSELAELMRELATASGELEIARANDARQARNLDGMLRRIEIAEGLGGSILYAIVGLLLAMELAPIFFKMSTRGAYEYLEENERRLRAAYQGVMLETVLVGGPHRKEPRLTERFLRAERVQAEERERLETETVLNQQMHTRFRTLRKAEIDAEPEKFLNVETARET
ncbi:MAG: DUF4407 domain-containing protein [Polyangiales bacterium]